MAMKPVMSRLQGASGARDLSSVRRLFWEQAPAETVLEALKRAWATPNGPSEAAAEEASAWLEWSAQESLLDDVIVAHGSAIAVPPYYCHRLLKRFLDLLQRTEIPDLSDRLFEYFIDIQASSETTAGFLVYELPSRCHEVAPSSGTESQAHLLPPAAAAAATASAASGVTASTPPPCPPPNLELPLPNATQGQDQDQEQEQQDQELGQGEVGQDQVVKIVIRVEPRHNEVGLRLWEAGIFLTDWLLHYPSLLRGKRVVELGAGVGLTGIAASRCTALEQIVLTDAPPDVMENLRTSLRSNGHTGHDDDDDDHDESSGTGGHIGRGMDRKRRTKHGVDAAKLLVKDLDWTDGGHAARERIGEVDVILAADVVYDVSVVPALVEVIEALLQPRLPSSATNASEEVRDASQDTQHKFALVAQTERNLDTLKSFLHETSVRGLACEDLTRPSTPSGQVNAGHAPHPLNQTSLGPGENSDGSAADCPDGELPSFFETTCVEGQSRAHIRLYHLSLPTTRAENSTSGNPS